VRGRSKLIEPAPDLLMSWLTIRLTTRRQKWLYFTSCVASMCYKWI
jgi:hypothetical protein